MSKPKRNFDNFDSGEPKLTDKQQAFIAKRDAAPEPPPLDKVTQQFVKNVLDRQGWLKSRTRQKVGQDNKIARGVYVCECCDAHIGCNDYEVDHLVSRNTPGEKTSLDDWIRRTFCGQEGLALVCKPCHKMLTYRDHYAK